MLTWVRPKGFERKASFSPKGAGLLIFMVAAGSEGLVIDSDALCLMCTRKRLEDAGGKPQDNSPSVGPGGEIFPQGM